MKRLSKGSNSVMIICSSVPGAGSMYLTLDFEARSDQPESAKHSLIIIGKAGPIDMKTVAT